MTGVPLLDLTRADPRLLEQLREAFDRVLRSGRYILGPEVETLEAECARIVGTRHAIGVSSGTDALLLALMALGIGPGDEVVCPTFTFFATAGSVWRLGAKPVFVDIDPVTFNCDAAAMSAQINERTKAVMPVHLYGQCANMEPILERANALSVPVIEDAAQAIGTQYDGKNAGAMGTFGCFSFFPTKNLGCLGDGGLVTCDDDALSEHAQILRVHGGEPKYYHAHVGGNFRIDALQAALLNVLLEHLPARTERRRANATRYRELFHSAGLVASPDDPEPGKIGLPAEVQPSHVYNQFVIRVYGQGCRDELRTHLTTREIGTEIYYPVPLHLQECFRPLGHRPGDFPHAEAAAREVLALPIFPELRDDETSLVVERIVEWSRGRLG